MSKADIPENVSFESDERGRSAARYASGLRAPVTITVNGEPRDVADGLTVDALLAALAVRRDGTAVALNDTVVPRARYEATTVREGDRVEIIVAVAGG
jgi:sulfur carrier protein